VTALVPDPSWLRRGLAVVFVLAALAPAASWAAGAVGYAEPLDRAAEATGAADDARTVVPAPLPDYSVPGLGAGPGTLGAALAGTGLTLAAAVGLARVLR
jgi:cobalt/nickel transport protein